MALYVVTGGAGFIGSHVADAVLAAGHRVRVVDDFSTGRATNLDPRCEVIRGSVCDLATMRAALSGAAGCYHLAAIASVARANEDWLGTHQVNQSGLITVLDAAKDAGGVPVVYASSAAVYGTLSGVATEQAVPAPQTAYGADKFGCELHARVGFLVHGVPSVGLRFFNVYGPRQDPGSPYSGVISIFARAIGAGLPVTVHGDGRQTRDFVYVADVVAHVLASMRAIEGAPGCHVFNVCTGTEISVLQLIESLAGASGRDVMIVHGPSRAGDISRSVGSAALARAVLGVSAQTSLGAGLRATIDSFTPVRALEAVS